MRRIMMLSVLLVAGCAPEEPAWQEGELGEWQPGLTVGGAGGCSTFIVDGLSRQLIDEQNCIRPNALVSFKGASGVSIGANVYPYLEQKAHDGLVAAAKSLTLDVSSAFRTLAQQYLLYKWYQAGQCGISLAAVPGNSNHETGIAVDLSNYSAALSAMTNHGFTHSYPSSDPVHFDYTAGGTTDLRAESVLAFQKLWNLNNPNDKIAEDGAYGPMTAARVAKAPADGFAKGSTCAPQSNPAPNPAPSPSTKPSTQPSTEPSTTPSTEPSTTPSTEPSTTPSPSDEPSPSDVPQPSAPPVDDDPQASPSPEPDTNLPADGDPTVMPHGSDASAGCSLGGAADASPLAIVLVLLAIGGRRRRDDLA
jgi:hypothetical protein